MMGQIGQSNWSVNCYLHFAKLPLLEWEIYHLLLILDLYQRPLLPLTNTINDQKYFYVTRIWLVLKDKIAINIFAAQCHSHHIVLSHCHNAATFFNMPHFPIRHSHKTMRWLHCTGSKHDSHSTLSECGKWNLTMTLTFLVGPYRIVLFSFSG